MPCGIDVTSVVLINFTFFIFIFQKLKYVLKNLAINRIL